jgi:hypothetical protein
VARDFAGSPDRGGSGIPDPRILGLLNIRFILNELRAAAQLAIHLADTSSKESAANKIKR